MSTDDKKPRIAIYYDNRYGRNDGPPLYYWNQMKKLGMDVHHFIPEGDITKKYGKFDLHFWVDWGEDALGLTNWEIPDDGGKKIYVASDTHLDDGYRLRKAEKYDFVYFNQKRAFEEYKSKPGQGVGWLLHAFEPMAYDKQEILKKYDVCFIGHVQEQPSFNGFSRTEFLDRMFKEFPNFYFGTRMPGFPAHNMFEDAALKFSKSKIVLNISAKDDINMRVFETLGTGGFLLTNWIPTINEVFKEGVHLVTYKTLDEAVEKAKYYLEHDDEREAIAEAGYQEAHTHHKYENRIKDIMASLSL